MINEIILPILLIILYYFILSLYVKLSYKMVFKKIYDNDYKIKLILLCIFVLYIINRILTITLFKDGLLFVVINLIGLFFIVLLILVIHIFLQYKYIKYKKIINSFVLYKKIVYLSIFLTILYVSISEILSYMNLLKFNIPKSNNLLKYFFIITLTIPNLLLKNAIYLEAKAKKINNYFTNYLFSIKYDFKILLKFHLYVFISLVLTGICFMIIGFIVSIWL
jgi:hypothetical protein